MARVRYTRNVFLRGMSIVYLFAFTSFYIQIPGLYGNNGILPAKTELDSKATSLTARIHNKPTLLWLAPYIGLNTEYMMDVLALFGIFLSFTGFISQKFCTASTFAALWSLYYSLYQVGQTFMWFQWDILLLEAGFLSFLVAPLRYKPGSRRKHSVSASDSVTLWAVRWLLFRLMFSSGVVKLTSGCPTWWGLSALSVHFESQCIPTALAWYAHHLPKWFLKLSTAGSLVIELLLPFLFFFPLRPVRIVAFYLQIFLQVAIILTGNYNFFNLLAIVLCISLLDDDFFFKRKLQRTKTNFWMGILKTIGTLVVYGAVLYATYFYCSLKLTSNNTIESNIAFSKQEFDKALGKAVPISVYVGLVSFAVAFVEAISTCISDKSINRVTATSTTILYSFAVLLLFGLSTVPHSTLHPAGNRTVLPAARVWHIRLNHLHLTNSYGLFRRMTGVGGRPEVVIEGSDNLDGPWKEYQFLYKPGNVNATPPFVAPYQPRLDWQMWFAALGTYHQNPWLMSLAYRLLNGQPEVLQLLDISKNPFPAKPPIYVRATLYHYHYTPWSKRSSNSWWTREKVSEYFPVFAKDHKPLVDYLMKRNIIADDTKGKESVLPLMKLILDRLRFFASHVEPSILLWSLFSAGCAIIATTGNNRKEKEK